jgi:hypothetical protein
MSRNVSRKRADCGAFWRARIQEAEGQNAGEFLRAIPDRFASDLPHLPHVSENSCKQFALQTNDSEMPQMHPSIRLNRTPKRWMPSELRLFSRVPKADIARR